ncbi:hypothetical protein STEG23_032207 [Scotinomys teguina]
MESLQGSSSSKLGPSWKGFDGFSRVNRVRGLGMPTERSPVYRKQASQTSKSLFFTTRHPSAFLPLFYICACFLLDSLSPSMVQCWVQSSIGSLKRVTKDKLRAEEHSTFTYTIFLRISTIHSSVEEQLSCRCSLL